MSFSELRFDWEDVHAHDDFVGHALPHLRLLDDSEVPPSGELHPAPPCGSCFEAMAPVGASGWWCDACQEYQ